MGMRMGSVGEGALAILREDAINDLAVERREHTATRTQLSRERAAHDRTRTHLKLAVLVMPFFGACIGALAVLAYFL